MVLKIRMKKIIFESISFIESCFNKKQDDDEDGIDCGGHCRIKCVGNTNSK